jgi:heat shock protein 4
LLQIGPFQAHSEKSKVKVKIRLNLHGLISVESAVVSVNFHSHYLILIISCLMLFVTFKLSQLIDDDQRDANSADSMEVDSNDDMVRGCQLSLSLDLSFV